MIIINNEIMKIWNMKIVILMKWNNVVMIMCENEKNIQWK